MHIKHHITARLSSPYAANNTSAINWQKDGKEAELYEMHSLFDSVPLRKRSQFLCKQSAYWSHYLCHGLIRQFFPWSPKGQFSKRPSKKKLWQWLQTELLKARCPFTLNQQPQSIQFPAINCKNEQLITIKHDINSQITEITKTNELLYTTCLRLWQFEFFLSVCQAGVTRLLVFKFTSDSFECLVRRLQTLILGFQLFILLLCATCIMTSNWKLWLLLPHCMCTFVISISPPPHR